MDLSEHTAVVKHIDEFDPEDLQQRFKKTTTATEVLSVSDLNFTHRLPNSVNWNRWTPVCAVVHNRRQ